MKLKNVLILIYLLLNTLVFVTFIINPLVWFSFFINAVFLLLIFLHHLKIEKNYSPFISAYITFNFLFFIVAPIIQINGLDGENTIFPNSFPYSASTVIYTNFVIFIFHISFFLSYIFYKKKVGYKITQNKEYKQSYYLPLVLFVLLIVSFFVLIYTYDYLTNLITESNWITIKRFKLSVSKKLIIKKVLFMIPFAGLILSRKYLITNKKITKNTIIIFFLSLIFFVLLFLFINPLTDKRNAIGPIYITILFLFYPKLLNTNTKSFLFLFSSLVIFFPLVSSLTHLDASIKEIISNPSLILEQYGEEGLIKTFATLHYDAFANIAATIDFVKNEGMTYGYQLLSALLFFVPRSVWPSKPNSTGELIGDYLIEDYGFVYSNLSNPIVSEGYVNYGILGVILMAFALSYFVCKFMVWIKSNNPLKEIIAFYFGVHLLFLLRGDFTNGFSYFIGIMIGVFFIPNVLDQVLRLFFYKSKR